MGSRGASSGRGNAGSGGGAAVSDINGAKRQEFTGAQSSEAYQAIAKLTPDSSSWINVTYSTGEIKSFRVARDPRDTSSMALIRYNSENPLAMRSLKFKSSTTVKNRIIEEGKRGKNSRPDAAPTKIVINPNKGELDINRA